MAASLACGKSDGSETAAFRALRFPPESTSHKHKVLVKFKKQGKRECTGNIYGKDEGKKTGGKKMQKLIGFKKKDFCSKITFFICKTLLPRCLPKDFILM